MPGHSWPKLKRDWKGRRVKLLRTVSNRGGQVFRAGRVMEVQGFYRGLALKGLRSRTIITRVPVKWVELLP